VCVPPSALNGSLLSHAERDDVSFQKKKILNPSVRYTHNHTHHAKPTPDKTTEERKREPKKTTPTAQLSTQTHKTSTNDDVESRPNTPNTSNTRVTDSKSTTPLTNQQTYPTLAKNVKVPQQSTQRTRKMITIRSPSGKVDEARTAELFLSLTKDTPAGLAWATSVAQPTYARRLKP
jgi:hypothetical protein